MTVTDLVSLAEYPSQFTDTYMYGQLDEFEELLGRVYIVVAVT